MWTKWGVATAIVLFVACGCGQQGDDDGPDDDLEETGVAVAVDVHEETDVAGFEYTVSDCEDGDEVIRETRDLEELVVPGEIPAFVDEPFDGDSEHQFADFFQLLDEGCYDIVVEPIDETGSPSSDCHATGATEVFVVEGKTTEIVLTSQCKGDKRGASDVVAALNHPPVIESVDYEPSKFVHECEKVDICVTAYDPDGDPMEFEFEQTEGQQLRFDLETTEPEYDGNRATSCMQAVPVWNDDYQFEVSVYDMVREDGQKVRAQEAFDEESRATRTFEMYSNWDIELECYDRETELFHHFEGVREIDRAEECIPIWPEEYFCSDFHWDETDRTCPDGEFAPETVYPLCEDFDADMYESDGRSLGEERW